MNRNTVAPWSLYHPLLAVGFLWRGSSHVGPGESLQVMYEALQPPSAEEVPPPQHTCTHAHTHQELSLFSLMKMK